MNNSFLRLLFFFASCSASTISSKNCTEIHPDKLSPHEVSFTIPVPAGSFLYKEYLDVSSDNPDVVLTSWQAEGDAVPQYDPQFKETKKVYTKNLRITATTKTMREPTSAANIHVTYFLNTNKKITESLIPLTSAPTDTIATAIEAASEVIETPAQNQPSQAPETPAAKESGASFSWSRYISSLVKTTESLAVRLLLVFFLGILLSLTPCIYPMIPITVGILQSQGSKSIGYNFLTSLCYTTGISITFACLGLLAAFTGHLFGSIMNNPFVIIAIVLMLLYLAFSMFGLYDMYVPKSLRNNNSSVQKGNKFLSAFVFGIASGTVASPCLSPGLVLLLSIVTTLGSAWLGFFLLFVFGIGLSLPLLIIGTFSSSLSMLPRAGMWMVEIKTLFGFMLLGMCFYFLKVLIPWYLMSWMITAFVAIMGIFYIYAATKPQSSTSSRIKTIFGILLVAVSVVLAAQSYTDRYKTGSDKLSSFWLPLTYEQAKTQAQEHNKKIFLAFGAPSCSLCKAIDKNVFTKERIMCTLKNCYCIKLEESTQADEAYRLLQKEYKILGFPTYLLIDPHSCAELQRWGGELYDMPESEFIDDLNKFIQAGKKS